MKSASFEYTFPHIRFSKKAAIPNFSLLLNIPENFTLYVLCVCMCVFVCVCV